jgi:superfamily I DNA and RNA helicase
VKLVGKIVDDLLEQRFDYGDIIVLTTCHVTKPAERRSALDGKERAGKHRLRRFTNEYDLFGNQVLTDGKLRFESVYRFKGQQAPAVILMDVDPAADTLDHDRRVLFSGMTRATVRLEVVARRGNPLNEAMFACHLVTGGSAMEPTP